MSATDGSDREVRPLLDGLPSAVLNRSPRKVPKLAARGGGRAITAFSTTRTSSSVQPAPLDVAADAVLAVVEHRPQPEGVL